MARSTLIDEVCCEYVCSVLIGIMYSWGMFTEGQWQQQLDIAQGKVSVNLSPGRIRLSKPTKPTQPIMNKMYSFKTMK